MNRIYISDLDGTLLRNDATLSSYSREALNKLINDGVKFTIASARNIFSIQTILQNLPLELPVIASNGAYISDYKTGKHIIINDMYNELCLEVLELIKEHDFNPFISSYDGRKNNLYYEEADNYGMKWYLEDRKKVKDKRLKQVNNIKKVLKENIVSFTIMNRKENLIQLTQYLEDKYEDRLEIILMDNQYSPGWYWLTIYDKKATKEEAMKTLIKYTDLTEYEKIVFGDNVNDIKMFKGADRAIAVENAKDELKEHAHEIIDINEKDSVVKFILNNEYERVKQLQEA